MKIGISLPWAYLADIYDRDKASETIYRDCGEPRIFLETLKNQGCTSVEMRHWNKDLTDNDMTKAFENITNAGLSFSIHGDIDESHVDKNLYDAFPWFSSALNGLKKSPQKEFIITMHPVKKIDGNNEQLKSLSESILKHYCMEIEKNTLPIKIAYENQREKGFTDPATKFTSISASLSLIKRKEIGTCWDMGHSYANFLKNKYEELPDDLFLENAIHTHIHDLAEKTGATHWPLIFGNTPVEKYIGILKKHGYSGLYNLELSTERFRNLNVKKSMLESIDILKGILK